MTTNNTNPAALSNTDTACDFARRMARAYRLANYRLTLRAYANRSNEIPAFLARAVKARGLSLVAVSRSWACGADEAFSHAR
jgi:hypothetical protein